MDGGNLQIQSEEKELMIELLENINTALKDSDAAEEKDLAKEMLRSASRDFTFIAVGNSNVGKSRFLQSFFQNSLYKGKEIEATVGIHEIRSGDLELVIQVDRMVTRHFVREDRLKGIRVIDMQGLRQLQAANAQEEIERYASQGDVLFAVFEVGSVKDHEVWDLLVHTSAAHIIFVLTKCDLVERSKVNESLLLIRQYMADEGIHAPVFSVSAVWEDEGKTGESDMTALGRYVSHNILGKNPVFAKQWDNIIHLKKILKDLSESFGLRKKQYEEDAAILKNIDRLLNAFRLDSGEQIEKLKETLAGEIEQEIDRFQDEIIVKLAPMQIRERFEYSRKRLNNEFKFIQKVHWVVFAENMHKNMFAYRNSP